MSPRGGVGKQQGEAAVALIQAAMEAAAIDPTGARGTQLDVANA